MDRSRAFLFFVLFVAAFCASLTFDFNYFYLNCNSSDWGIPLIAISLLASSAALAFCARAFAQNKPFSHLWLASMVAVGLVFFGATTAENGWSDELTLSHITPKDFAELPGHCGKHAGRAILKLLHTESTAGEGAFAEFKLQQRCRLMQLERLMVDDSKICQPNEDSIACQMRWMSGIADKGYWSRYTRKFFFDQVMKRYQKSKNTEALVDYAVRDQELELGRQSIVRQAGIEDTFVGRFVMVQQKEELDNLLLTQEIIKTIKPLVPDASVMPPPPYLFKFRDLQAEVDTKIARIPEIQNEIEQIKKVNPASAAIH